MSNVINLEDIAQFFGLLCLSTGQATVRVVLQQQLDVPYVWTVDNTRDTQGTHHSLRISLSMPLPGLNNKRACIRYSTLNWNVPRLPKFYLGLLYVIEKVSVPRKGGDINALLLRRRPGSMILKPSLLLVLMLTLTVDLPVGSLSICF